MADFLSVNPEAMADALARMDEFQRAAEALLTEVDNTVESLHVTWSGGGAAAHAQAHKQWSHGAAMMRDALQQLHTAGGDAHGNYTGAMSTNRKMWS